MCAIFGLWIKLRKSSFACCGWHLPFPTLGYATILLTRNQMIFFVQFGINKHLLIFSKTANCTSPTGSCNFVSLWKSIQRSLAAGLVVSMRSFERLLGPCYGASKACTWNKAHLSSVIICNGLWNVFSGNKWHNVHTIERKLSVLTNNLVEA